MPKSKSKSESKRTDPQAKENIHRDCPSLNKIRRTPADIHLALRVHRRMPLADNDPLLAARACLAGRHPKCIARDPHRALRARRRGVREPVALLRRRRALVHGVLRLELFLLLVVLGGRRRARLVGVLCRLGGDGLDDGRGVRAVLQTEGQRGEQGAVRVVEDRLEAGLCRRAGQSIAPASSTGGVHSQ